MDKNRMINDHQAREPDETIYARYLKTSADDDLKELLARHRSDLTFFIYGFVNNMEDAEDIMMDAFAVAASGIAKFSGKSSFKTWLFGIGRNLALKHLRKRHFHFFPLNEETDGAQRSSGDDGMPDARILRTERRKMLYKALGSINPDYRQVLHLTYFENMDNDEVALVMKKSKKQVYNLISRGKTALKEELTRLGFDPCDL